MCLKCRTDPAQRAKHVNATTFARGPCPRRHQFSRAERQRGYHSAVGALIAGDVGKISDADTAAYVYRKVRSFYRRRVGTVVGAP